MSNCNQAYNFSFDSDEEYEEIEVQTRSESGRLNFFSSVTEAYQAWEKDPTIWKISFSGHRFRPKTKKELWSLLSEDKMRRMSEKYAKALENELFWINQSLMPEDKYFQIYTKLKSEAKNQDEIDEAEDFYMSKCIKEVLSDEEFRNKYCGYD